MLEIQYLPQLKEMSNYLEDDWLSSEQQQQYSSYPDQIQGILGHNDMPSLPYGHTPYRHPRSVPVTYAGSTGTFVGSSESMTHTHSYDGLELMGPGVFQNLRSPPPPASTSSSPRLSAQAGIGDSIRVQSYGSPIPPTPRSSRLVLSRSPVLTGHQADYLLPSQSSVPPTPRNSQALPHQNNLAPLPSISQASRALKRSRDDNEHSDSSALSQRRRSRSASLIPRLQAELSEEEQLLLKLKHEESLPWKDIAREFEARLNRVYQVPALQMRYKRLRERLRTWNEDDVQALRAAHEYWEKSKFEIISQKMLEFGAAERWPARLCERKWEELQQPLGEEGQIEGIASSSFILQESPAPPEGTGGPSPDALRTAPSGEWTFTGINTKASIPGRNKLDYTREDGR